MFQQWLNSLNLNTAQARHIDDDADGSFDCVDVPEDWCKFLWPNVPVGTTLGYGNAKDHYGSASATYFDKLPGNITAQPGDIPVWGATSTNPYGHIAVTISDDGTNLMVVEQNTYTQEAATIAHRSHNNLIGFLRPRIEEEDMGQIEALQTELTAERQGYQDLVNAAVKIADVAGVSHAEGQFPADQVLAKVQELVNAANELGGERKGYDGFVAIGQELADILGVPHNPGQVDMNAVLAAVKALKGQPAIEVAPPTPATHNAPTPDTVAQPSVAPSGGFAQFFKSVLQSIRNFKIKIG